MKIWQKMSLFLIRLRIIMKKSDPDPETETENISNAVKIFDPSSVPVQLEKNIFDFSLVDEELLQQSYRKYSTCSFLTSD